MPFEIDEIRRKSQENYEKAWLDSKNLLSMEGNLFQLQKKGKSHIIQDFIQDARNKIINLGFEELLLPMFVEEEEIYKQYGPEAVLILDRLYYLAGLPRPDIGISKEKLEKIKAIVNRFNKIDQLKTIFRSYKIGDIEADDLIEEFVNQLSIKESEATEIIDKVFPELKDVKPIPTKTTLRSHTTALWFKVLSELKKKRPLPLQYFSIGKKFRREQKIDTTHLYDSYTLSLVVMAKDISLEDCQNIAAKLCEILGFEENRTQIKRATSKYYAPQTEFEIFVKHPKMNEWIEIGDGGFYSPISLAQYNIEYPVFNIGFGVERICMIKTGIEDIRKLVFPYFYEDISFTDQEIAKSIKYHHVPSTPEGIEIKDAIIRTAIQNQERKSPIEIKVWEGKIKGKNIVVVIYEEDDGVNLLGPAALNEIYVNEGDILGLPPNEIPIDAQITNKTYLEGIANEMAYNIEVSLDQNKRSSDYRVKMCYRASEINLEIDDVVMEFIHSHQKKIDIRGPVFVGLSYRIKKNDNFR